MVESTIEQEPAQLPTAESIDLVGRIPVRNIWWLYLYASDLLKHVDQSRRIVLERNPDEIADLVAEILCFEVERRLKRNLSSSYQTRDAVLRRVRGRIDIFKTERFRLLERGAVACRFDEFTVDTPRNRLVRAALETISGVVDRTDLASRCRGLGDTLRRLGVLGRQPTRIEASADQIGRHDAEDRRMVAAAWLAFNLTLPTEAPGKKPLTSPSRDAVWLRRLYEKGIGGFYSVVLSDRGWRVMQGKGLSWPISDPSPRIKSVLPTMIADIVLEHSETGRRTVIDTKFNSLLSPGWYRDETLHSGYIYQIYAYLRSQESRGDPLAANATGILLHPSVGEMIDERVTIQGHEIRFETVDLAADAQTIRSQLLAVVGASGIE